MNRRRPDAGRWSPRVGHDRPPLPPDPAPCGDSLLSSRGRPAENAGGVASLHGRIGLRLAREELRGELRSLLSEAGFGTVELAPGSTAEAECDVVVTDAIPSAEEMTSPGPPVVVLVPAGQSVELPQAGPRAPTAFPWPEGRSALPGLLRVLARVGVSSRRIRRVAFEVAPLAGPELFHAVVRFAAEELGADLCLVGELLGDPPTRVRTHAVWKDGELAEPLEYDLAGTPCEEAVRSSFCFVPEKVSERFPGDPQLREHGFEAFMGCPLRDAAGRPVGVLSMAFRRPAPEMGGEVAPLRLFLQLLAGRAAGELERERMRRAVEQQAAQFRTLFRRVGAPTVLVRLTDRTIVDANEEWLAVTGLSREEIVGRTPAELGLDPEPEKTAERMAALEAAGKVRGLEFETVGPDGKRRWDLVNADLVWLDGLPHALVVSIDITAQKRAETALRESEERFRRLIEHAPEGLVLLDVATRKFVYANAAAERLFGMSREELAAVGPVDVSPPVQPDGRPSAEKAAEVIGRALAGETPVFEWVHRDATGRDIPCEVRLLRLDIDGRILIRGSVLDISERKRAEAQIQRLTRTYELLSAVHHAIVRLRDRDELLATVCRIAVDVGRLGLAWVGLVEGGNLRVKACAGADEETLSLVRAYVEGPNPDCAFTFRALRRGAVEVCRDIEHDPESVSWREAALARGLRSLASLPIRVGGQVVGTFNLYSRDSGLFDDEELRLFAILAEDIGFALEAYEQEAERRRTEAALRESEARFRSLIEHAADLIHVVDREGRVRYASPSSRRVLGRDPEDRVGRSVLEYVHPADVPLAREGLREAEFHPGRPAKREIRVRRADGTWAVLEVVASWVPDGAEGGFFVLNSRDITERRELEEQLSRAQRMEAVGRLAGGVAHDFNNTLAAILMEADLLAQEPGVPSSVKEGLLEIRSYAERAAAMTRRLLLLGRRQVLEPRLLELNETVTSLAGLLRRAAGEHIELVVETSDEPLWVEVDPTMLDQVLLNLVLNARDAMPRGGTVTVRCGARQVARPDRDGLPELEGGGRFAVLSVSDDGQGIAEEDLPHIFEPFFSTKEESRGTGLGLAVVYGIVRQHGGAIRVRSRVGEGTTFDIFLPLREPSPGPTRAPAPAQREAAVSAGGETILVVEDDPGIRALFAALLRREGFEVLEAGDAEEAFAVWEEHRERVHLLLTDVVLPGGTNGYQIASRIRSKAPHLPIIFMSGYSPETAPAELELRPGQNFLAKPFTPDVLLDAVNRALGR